MWISTRQNFFITYSLSFSFTLVSFIPPSYFFHSVFLLPDHPYSLPSSPSFLLLSILPLHCSLSLTHSKIPYKTQRRKTSRCKATFAPPPPEIAPQMQSACPDYSPSSDDLPGQDSDRRILTHRKSCSWKLRGNRRFAIKLRRYCDYNFISDSSFSEEKPVANLLSSWLWLHLPKTNSMLWAENN